MKVSIPGPRWHQIMLRVAAVMTLLALALMVWSVIQPTPMPVLLAMSLGQVLGTLAFGMYGLVVFADLRRQYVRRKEVEKESQRIATIRDAAPTAAAGTGAGTEGSDAGLAAGAGSEEKEGSA